MGSTAAVEREVGRVGGTTVDSEVEKDGSVRGREVGMERGREVGRVVLVEEIAETEEAEEDGEVEREGKEGREEERVRREEGGASVVEVRWGRFG